MVGHLYTDRNKINLTLGVVRVLLGPGEHATGHHYVLLDKLARIINHHFKLILAENTNGKVGNSPRPFFPPMTILTVNFVIFLGVLGIGLLSYNILKGPDRIKPPGPRRFPLIGNLLQMPVDTPWLTFSDWRKEYGESLPHYCVYDHGLVIGDVIHVDVLGKPILIVNSAQIAKELLDKRSSIYSDRPRLVCFFSRSM